MIERQLAAHPALVAQQNWIGVQRASHVMQANGAELKDYISRFENSAQLMPSGVDGEVFYLMALRHLLNYVGSAFTLVDHTRNLLATYEGENFLAEYETRKMAVTGTRSAAILKALRNYMIHRGQPVLGIDLEADPRGSAQWVVVDASDMLSWKKCPAPAKKYLSESRSIRILDLVQEYETSLGELYEWVFAQYQILHGGEIAEFQDLVQKLEAAYRPVSTFPLDASDEWSLKLHLRD
ncbi:hypothetical protein DLJ96_02480 [Actinotalea fermentans ATCC 43279 = JCM 9966 = DSM 3133]|nr:hypothetical protein DLJ96_02480 [Actinotalea fermentans ATCC 43279 = JCM 9966 = DSM 3133]